MLKYVFASVALFLITNTNTPSLAQNEAAENIKSFQESATDVFKKIDKKDETLKDRFINAHLPFFTGEYNMYVNANSKDKGNWNIDTLKSVFYVYDIDGDGRNDLIYTGIPPAEGHEIALILNKSNGFTEVFKDMQYVDKVEFQGQRISKLYISNPGCCASYITYHKIYDVSYPGNIPTFRLVYYDCIHTFTELPKSYLEKPIPFEVLNDGYKLRVKPRIDDGQGYMDEDHKGSTVALLAKGTRGIALAESTDNTGRVWWFVRIEPGAKLSKSVFYDEEGVDKNPYPLYTLGWMSSRFVKRLDN